MSGPDIADFSGAVLTMSGEQAQSEIVPDKTNSTVASGGIGTTKKELVEEKEFVARSGLRATEKFAALTCLAAPQVEEEPEVTHNLGDLAALLV